MADIEAGSPCRNCGFAPVRRYCGNCGQRARGRLELRQVREDFSDRFLGVDGTLVTTFWGLTVRPGETLRRYLAGERRRLLNPFTYLALAAALWWILISPDIPELTEQVRQGMEDVFAFLSPQQRDLYLRLQIGAAEYAALLYALSCLPFALYFRLLFRGSDLNLAESFVFGLYGYGHVQYLSLLTWALAFVVPQLDDLRVSTLVGMVIWAVYFCWAAAALLGRPIRTSLKMLAVLALSYATFLALHTAILMSIVLLAA